MFGLTFEKLFLVALVAGLVIGPSRLPVYAHRLTELLRSLRRLVDATRADAEREMGVTLTRAEWEALDPRQFDPRRIVRDALQEPSPAAGAGNRHDPVFDGATRAALVAEAARVRPGQKYLTSGSAAHPQRFEILSLPVDDPRRVAAYGAAPLETGTDAEPTDEPTLDQPTNERGVDRPTLDQPAY